MNEQNIIGLQWNDDYTRFVFHFKNIDTKEEAHIQMNKNDIESLYKQLSSIYEKFKGNSTSDR